MHVRACMCVYVGVGLTGQAASRESLGELWRVSMQQIKMARFHFQMSVKKDGFWEAHTHRHAHMHNVTPFTNYNSLTPPSHPPQIHFFFPHVIRHEPLSISNLSLV